jgi:hypothetical protein
VAAWRKRSPTFLSAWVGKAATRDSRTGGCDGTGCDPEGWNAGRVRGRSGSGWVSPGRKRELWSGPGASGARGVAGFASTLPAVRGPPTDDGPCTFGESLCRIVSSGVSSICARAMKLGVASEPADGRSGSNRDGNRGWIASAEPELRTARFDRKSLMPPPFRDRTAAAPH